MGLYILIEMFEKKGQKGRAEQNAVQYVPKAKYRKSVDTPETQQLNRKSVDSQHAEEFEPKHKYGMPVANEGNNKEISKEESVQEKEETKKKSAFSKAETSQKAPS